MPGAVSFLAFDFRCAAVVGAFVIGMRKVTAQSFVRQFLIIVGIGLAMTYRILQLHHGGIEVQSREDRGTEFRLRLPLAAADWGRRHLQPAGVEETKGFGE